VSGGLHQVAVVATHLRETVAPVYVTHPDGAVFIVERQGSQSVIAALNVDVVFRELGAPLEEFLLVVWPSDVGYL